MKPQGTLLLSRSDIFTLLNFSDYINVVEDAFRFYAEGKTLKPGLLHVDSHDGEFHIKAGGLELDQRYFALKVNGGFFHNMERFGMPNIQGTIVLCDGENGYPLAIMDSTEITQKRTGAATAVAAKYLARAASSSATICGTGKQARIHLQALKTVLPIKEVYVFSRERRNAEVFAFEMAEQLNIIVSPTDDLQAALAASDVCVTCTPARSYFLKKEYVRPGTFVAAVGADSPDKQELDPALISSSKLVTDILEQAAKVGELHHAIEAGMKLEAVHGEIGEIIAGHKPGRTSTDEITIYDSTGTALQDTAAAVAAYSKAKAAGTGQWFNLYN